MYPELITRPDIKVFLPPIGNLTAYICTDPLRELCHSLTSCVQSETLRISPTSQRN